ncbi:MAG: phage protein Gp36 family protein [Phycisphaerae bacterium]
MGYITNADVEERLGSSTYVQLTDDAGTGTADEDKVNEARLGAEGEVNSYLSRRVAVPVDLAGRPELAGTLRSVVLDLVEYRLRGRRPPVPAGVSRRRDEAVQWLERVAAGEVLLPAQAEMAANPVTGAMAASTGATRAMTREMLRDL